MYKVFINGNLLLITKHPVKNMPGYKKFFIEEFKKSDPFLKIIQTMEEEKPEKICICVMGEDLPLMWKKFRKNYQLVTAGGGLVRNQKNKILFIFRNEKWDLPKGKSDFAEPIELTAIREVKEECNIQNLILIRHLVDTYHTYGSKNNRKLKKTSWFRMYSEDKDLKPQKEEGITKIKWIKEEKLEKVYNNTYPNIFEVLKAEFNTIPGHTHRVWHSMINFE